MWQLCVVGGMVMTMDDDDDLFAWLRENIKQLGIIIPFTRSMENLVQPK